MDTLGVLLFTISMAGALTHCIYMHETASKRSGFIRQKKKGGTPKREKYNNILYYN